MKISVIIPAHNEEHNIFNALKNISSFLEKKHYDYEIIVSEDGSTDNTVEVARKFSKKNKKVNVIHSKKRLGKGGGILKGFKESDGDIVAFIDADLSSGPAELEKIVNAVRDGNDVAIASRNMKQSKIVKDRPFLRRIAAKGINILANSMFDLSVSDTQCGLKALSRDALKKILPQMTRNGFEFDIELLLRAKNFGMKIKEVPIIWEHKQETAKISGFPARTATKTGIGLLNLWIKNSFNRNDLFFFLFLALFIAFASTFLGTSIGADEGTHLSIISFFYDFFRDYFSHPVLSFSKIYDYTIAYLVHYTKISLYYPPGFYVIATFITYFFGLSSVTGAATGLLFGVATTLIVYYFGRRFVDKKTGIIAAVLFAVIPQIFYLSIKAMLDISYLLFFLLSMIFYLFALKSGKTRHFIYAGLFLAIGFFFKQNVIFVVPIIFLYTLFTNKKYLRKIFISFILAALIVSPYLFVFYKVGLLSVMLKSSIIWAGYDQHDPQFNTIEGWLYYPKQLGENYLSYPVFIAVILSLAYYIVRKEKYWQLFLIWFFTLFLFFVFIPNKEGRYLLPVIPVLLYSLSFYISKLPKFFSLATFITCFILIIYTSYLILSPPLYYNTNYEEIATQVVKKEGNTILVSDSDSFYSSAIIFEIMRQDLAKTHSVFRTCVMDIKDLNTLAKEDGIRYAIIPSSGVSNFTYTLNTSTIKNFPYFQLIKTFASKNTTIYVYENSNYVHQKQNCNYICITKEWICSNYTYPSNALR